MDITVLDFETYSPVPITAGSVKYMSHPDADIVCMSHKTLNESEHMQQWIPGKANPCCHKKKMAHNALFEYLVWNLIGVKKYGWEPVELEDFTDTQALGNRYSLPGALDKMGAILAVKVQKNPRGKVLMKKISVPTADDRRPVLGVDFSMDELLEYYDYCDDDVLSTEEIAMTLPSYKLSALEQQYWVLTQEMNLAGLPIDIGTAEKILSYIQSYAEDLTIRVPEITDGAVEKVTQVQKMVAWIQSQDVEIDNLQGPTVEALLKTPLPKDVIELLILRQTLGRSSTAKYSKMVEMELNGRIYNNLHYYGAGPGRWAGRGLQLHNLPKASVPNPLDYIRDFNNFNPVADPVNVAKALIRPMVKAPMGKMFLVSDYSSIENRILHWLAFDQKTLDLFRAGGDQYVDMATTLYEIIAEEVNKQQRQMGKIVILGCGYQMGGARFKDECEKWGIYISLHEAHAIVAAYRRKYHLVKKMWKNYSKVAVNAIRNPGKVYNTNRVDFKVVKDKSHTLWLQVTLPSGRAIYYMSPYLDQDDYGLAPGHWGTDPYSKKWVRRRLIPGRITENIDQGLARDIMAHGLMNVRNKMSEAVLIGTVHDEAIAEIWEKDITDDTLNQFNYHLCDMPAWADGLPLKAEGWIERRYRK